MRAMIRRGVRLSCLAGVLSAQTVVAQQVIRVDGRESCGRCSIDVTRLATLHPPSDEVSLRNIPPPDLAMDRQGRFIAGIAEGGSALVVFDANGRFLHTFGRFGEGPGEFSASRLFIRVGADDTVRVFQRNRESVLAPGARRFVRSQSLPVLGWDPVLVDGRVALRSTVHERGGRSTPIQLLDEERAVVLGLGARADRPLSARTRMSDRRLAIGSNGTGIWVSPWTAYELSLFSLEGEELVRVVRPEWFEPYDFGLVRGYSKRQPPIVDGVNEVAPDQLLVAISYGDPEYEPVSPETALDPFVDDRGRLDTRLEVLDVSSGELIVTQVFDEHLRFVTTSGGEQIVMFSTRSTPSGDLVLDVWEVFIRSERGTPGS